MNSLSDRYGRIAQRHKDAEDMMLAAAFLLEGDPDSPPPPTHLGMYSFQWEVNNDVDGGSYISRVKMVVSPEKGGPKGVLYYFVFEDSDLVGAERTQDPSEVPALVRELISDRSVRAPQD